MNRRLIDFSPSAQDLLGHLGALLATARRRQNRSMNEVSAACGLSETYYGMIERARRRPSGQILMKLMNILALTKRERQEAWLLFGRSHVADALRPMPDTIRQHVERALLGLPTAESSSVLKGEPALREVMARVEALWSTNKRRKLLAALDLVEDPPPQRRPLDRR